MSTKDEAIPGEIKPQRFCDEIYKQDGRVYDHLSIRRTSKQL